ncbi:MULTISPECIES: HAMP domain-containing sensor histidine kinase [unclassified Nocardia]|uniref:HAMP domain-containing sensor histidine kinase n=1 Tax=unclassified Nocardia TaxID=2637762 RepID=UPI001CE3D9F6|nr:MULTISPECIES: HAMP domain-containing sensor histidine kinase [unclassified Nocardia]
MMLRARITLVVIVVAVAAIAFTMASSYRGVRDLVADELDRGLNDRLDAVSALLDTGRTLPPRSDMTEQLLLPDGSVRPLTPGAAALPVSAADRAVADTGIGTAAADIELDGEPWGTLTKPRQGGGAIMVGHRYAISDRIENEFFWRTGGITALAVAVSALLSWLAIGRILRPVRRLLTATEHIAATNDLTTPLPKAGRDEIGRLTGSFAAMLTALRRSRDQQHRLVQDASHELRTPLTSIRGSAELLQRARGRLDPADERQVLSVLVQESAALDTLVAELVELATDQHTAEEPVPVDLPELAEDCAANHRMRTGRTITVTAAQPLPVRARPRAIARCVDNLIGNAVKFSPADTPVRIVIRGAELAVHDDGPGIPAADTTAVFDRFYRSAATQGTPGSGLGLAIVADIVAAHGGSVFAESGPGGRVGFRLPPQDRPRRTGLLRRS